MGLSFSVPEGIKVPSSLQNIYKELRQDLGCSIPSNGNLEKWAVQVIYLHPQVLVPVSLTMLACICSSLCYRLFLAHIFCNLKIYVNFVVAYVTDLLKN